jgi:hypothetical protein
MRRVKMTRSGIRLLRRESGEVREERRGRGGSLAMVEREEGRGWSYMSSVTSK